MLVLAGLSCGFAIAQGQEPAPPPPAVEPSPESSDTVEEESTPALEGADAVVEMMNSLNEAIEKDAAAESAGEPLLLDARKAVDLALSQNAQVFVAEDDVEAARARIGQARSQRFPQIKVSSTQTHTELQKRDTGMLFGELFTSLIGIGDLLETPEDFRTDRLTMTQVIYAGGQIKAATEASKYLAESQEYQRQATLSQVEYNAKEAYYTAAASMALVRVAESSVSTFERQLSDAKEMFEVGMTSNFEVLRADTELGSRNSTLVQARNGQRLALANLCRAIGVPQNTPLQLETKLDFLPFMQDLDALIAHADEHRPELLGLRKAIDAGEQDVKRVRGQYKPSVGGNVQWQNVDNGGAAQPDGWTFSVSGQWDITTGGRRKYETLESKARLSSLEHQLQDLHAIVELDVKAAQIQIQDAMARVASERGTRTLAREGLRLAELRFQEGAGTQSEVLDAELALTSADTALVQALRDFAVANSSLERAIGKSWVRDTETSTGEQPIAPPPQSK